MPHNPFSGAPAAGRIHPHLTHRSTPPRRVQMKKQTKSVRKRFLIATLQQEAPGGHAAGGKHPAGKRPAAAKQPPAASRSSGDTDDVDAEISHELVDKRMDFLRLSLDRHWQFDELRRAHFSTMMVLAHLGGPPSES